MTHKQKLRWIVIGVIVALVAVFCYQNSDSVTAQFLGIKLEMPLALLLPLTMGAGVVVGWLLGRRRKA